jgi:hypothetical protein
MGLISKVVEAAIDTYLLVTSEIYPDYSRESRAIFPPGFEGWPITDDLGLVVEVGGSGKTGFLGVFPAASGGLEAGEVRIYSRDGDGNIKAFVICKADGTIRLENDSGFAELNGSSGQWKVNDNFTVDP